MTRATCHCGAVELWLRNLPDPASAIRCDCSFCRRRQAANISVKLADLEIRRGADNLALYSWNTHTAKHYFCKTCGIYTHHQRRVDPGLYGVNVYCIEGVTPADLEPVAFTDGVNHPSDA